MTMALEAIVTERLLLRVFEESDFAAVHAYASQRENTLYVLWGPNSEDDTRAHLKTVIEGNLQVPCQDRQYAVVVRETGHLIGAGNIFMHGSDEAEVGWIVNRDYWGMRYGTEIGKALRDYAFGTLGVRRLVARCDTGNTGSWKLMEKIGMRREAHFLQSRPAAKNANIKYGDEFAYAMLRNEWESIKYCH